MDASVQQLVAPVGQIIWAVVIGTITIVGAVGTGLWKVWTAIKGTMREEVQGVRQEVAGVKTDLAELKSALPQTIRQEVDGAIARHEVSETKALAEAMGPVRERLAVLETLVGRSRAKRARA